MFCKLFAQLLLDDIRAAQVISKHHLGSQSLTVIILILIMKINKMTMTITMVESCKRAAVCESDRRSSEGEAVNPRSRGPFCLQPPVRRDRLRESLLPTVKTQQRAETSHRSAEAATTL